MTDEHDELTPEEQAEFAALPRERVPSALLEERTVNALRVRGVLARPHRPVAWWVTAAAAALALFAGGFAAGQFTTTRGVATELIAAQQQTAEETARLVQRTGSAYVAALAALVAMADSTGPAVDQGREAARTALYAAAIELVALVPDDPVAIHIQRLLDGLSPAT